ncbi:NAD(+) diphosphatase [Catenovulum sp. SM1970]|uniref:NAD(+) diphosphatase n=1 Tax=Marinifaba aquimaris TaxID=2741323 RepID=UPI0015733D17|nr:NAD(+) diphosphatase [Marinifaba aquimaris]NTS78597.1 NAD(+) diphosphatase [Marinifaba aquimaris]
MLKNTHHALDRQQSVYWIVVKNEMVWLLNQGQTLPKARLSQLSQIEDDIDALYLDEYEQGEESLSCYALDADDLDLSQMPEDLAAGSGAWFSLRDIVADVPVALFDLTAKALQFSHFHQTHRFCGRCGRPMQRVKWEVANHCHACKHRCYPRLSPCIIVAITRHNAGKTQLLLAKGTKSATGKFSALAGFVEPSETLEQAVSREVFEEVGIEVKNIEYYASQPWPFPHNIMVGFTAEYESGDLVLDEKEIAEAAWFDLEQLPDVPRTYSISGKLIQYVLQKHNADSQVQ